MNEPKYQIAEVLPSEHSKWNENVEKSPEATIFHRHDFLQSARQNGFKMFWIKKGEYIKAGFSVLVGNALVEEDDFVIHSGLFFLPPDPKDNSNRQKVLSDRYQMTQDYVAYMTQNFPSITITLAPGVTDLRPFQWFNYHSDNPNTRFQTEVRYTTQLTWDENGLESADGEHPLATGLGSSRRQEIRYARKDNVEAINSENVEDFVELYRLTMSKASSADSEKLERMKALMRGLIQRKQAELLVVESEGRIISGCFWAWDSKRGYYLFGANHPEIQSRYSGSVVLWDAIRSLEKKNIRCLDFEGVNSPRRGWFKLSFGGELVPYYQVVLKGDKNV